VRDKPASNVNWQVIDATTMSSGQARASPGLGATGRGMKLGLNEIHLSHKNDTKLYFM